MSSYVVLVTENVSALSTYSGFDYLPTSKRSQKCLIIVTRECCMTMLGAPIGWCNTPQRSEPHFVGNFETSRYKYQATSGLSTAGGGQFVTCREARPIPRCSGPVSTGG